MLHIFFGDAVGGTFKQIGITGEIFIWHEIFTEGPIQEKVYDEPFFTSRVKYLDGLGITENIYRRAVEQFNNMITSCEKYDEIIVWCEHDLYDQTLLIYLLVRMAQQNLVKGKLKMITTDKFPEIPNFKGLGQLNTKQLSSLWGTQKTVNENQLFEARQAWEAYACANPTKIIETINNTEHSLPYLKSAFEYHLRRFPSKKDGLSELERYILTQVNNRPGRNVAVYCGECLKEGLFPDLGDWQYYVAIKHLCDAKKPLLSVDGDLISYMKLGNISHKEKCKVYVTEVGKKVLVGKINAIEKNGVDRWVGGVHII